MVLQSQTSSAAAGATRPTVPCQDEPASTPSRWFLPCCRDSLRGALGGVSTAFGVVSVVVDVCQTFQF